ncbi:MAG: hypothetical protein R3F39_05700 [Myxococcota bacterium]
MVRGAQVARIGLAVALVLSACGDAATVSGAGDGAGVDSALETAVGSETAVGPGDTDGAGDAAPQADAEVGPDAAPAADTLVLDPATLQFFGLPINSVRYAVSGYDAAHRTCATLIWDYSNNGQAMRSHCDDFFPGFPYVIVTPDTDGPCGAWEYGGLSGSTTATGCVDFAEASSAGTDLVDVRVTVADPAFTGVIVADNRALQPPRAVSLCLTVPSETDDPVWVQTTGEDGRPGWVRVLRDGVPIEAFDPCDMPACGEAAPACYPWPGRAEALAAATAPASPSACVTWDGRERVRAAGATCYTRAEASDGDYTVETCYGSSTTPGPQPRTVNTPTCLSRPLPLGAEQVNVLIPESK